MTNTNVFLYFWSIQANVLSIFEIMVNAFWPRTCEYRRWTNKTEQFRTFVVWNVHVIYALLSAKLSFEEVHVFKRAGLHGSERPFHASQFCIQVGIHVSVVCGYRIWIEILMILFNRFVRNISHKRNQHILLAFTTWDRISENISRYMIHRNTFHLSHTYETCAVFYNVFVVWSMLLKIFIQFASEYVHDTTFIILSIHMWNA